MASHRTVQSPSPQANYSSRCPMSVYSRNVQPTNVQSMSDQAVYSPQVSKICPIKQCTARKCPKYVFSSNVQPTSVCPIKQTTAHKCPEYVSSSNVQPTSVQSMSDLAVYNPAKRSPQCPKCVFTATKVRLHSGAARPTARKWDAKLEILLLKQCSTAIRKQIQR